MTALRVHFWIALIFALIPVALPAQTTGELLSSQTMWAFHPDSTLRLGYGMSPDHLDQAMVECVTGVPTPDRETGAQTLTYSSSLLQSTDDLRKALNIDARIDASYLGYSANGSFSYSYSGLFTSHSLTFAIRAEQRLPSVRWAGPYALTKDAEDRLREFGPDAFYRACGSFLAVNERRGASVAVLLTVNGLTSEEKTRIMASLGGGANVGAASVSGSITVSQSIEHAASEGRLDIRVLAMGGGTLADLRDVVAATLSGTNVASVAQSSTVVQRLGEALKTYLQSFDNKSPAQLGFDVKRMSDIFPRLKSPSLIGDLRFARLTRLVDEYRWLTSAREAAVAIRNGFDPRKEVLSLKDAERLAQLVDQVESHLVVVATIHDSCRSVDTPLTNCAVPKRPTFVTSVPDLPAPPRKAFWVSTDGASLSADQATVVAERALSGLLDAVRVYHHEAASARIGVHLTGEYLTTAVLRFRANVAVPEGKALGDQQVSALAITPEGGAFELANERGPFRLMEIVREFQARNPNGAGVFEIELRDQLRRSWSMPLVESTWSGNARTERLIVAALGR